NYAESGIQTDL
nr:Chain B, Nucleoporin NUP159 [Saccharomyces cerevisiae S288C]4DS1_D Chain D, Nucleoporin NUP159 [Saccharomyces cerevisiae S288C]